MRIDKGIQPYQCALSSLCPIICSGKDRNHAGFYQLNLM